MMVKMVSTHIYESYPSIIPQISKSGPCLADTPFHLSSVYSSRMTFSNWFAEGAHK